MIEPRQIRAARALLNWSQDDLASASGIARSSIKNIENDITTARKDTIHDIQSALENCGIEFIAGSGVRIKNEAITILRDADALRIFFDDIYTTMQNSIIADILISGVDEKAYDDFDKELVNSHLERMKKLGDVKQKVICKKGDTNFTVSYAKYKWVEKEMFESVPFYVYGNKLAMILWQPKLQIIILEYPQLVEAYRKQFQVMWNSAEIPIIK